MLKNMRDPGGIWWVCPEADGKDIVLVGSRHMQIVRIRLVVLEVKGREL